MPLSPSPVLDGFERALDNDREAATETLRVAFAGDDRSSQAGKLIEDLYGCLRSPIYPRRAGRDAAMALLIDGIKHRLPVRLRAVLASSSAEQELPFFLALAGRLRDMFPVWLELLLVRWENLDSPQPAHDFRRCREGVGWTVAQAGWPQHVVDPVDVRTAALGYPAISSPNDFAVAWQEVASACRGAHTDPRLLRDRTWSAGFYERQRSLHRLGPEQPYFDLALRRAIGRRLSSPQLDGRAALIVTSELHRRFLPCYAASFPILNISTTRQSDQPVMGSGLLRHQGDREMGLGQNER